MVPTEQQEAETLAAYLRVHKYYFTHIPNETGSDPAARRRAVRMKRAGVSKGFPDYLIFTPSNKMIAIELKRSKGGRATAEQKDWLTVLDQYGFNCAICHGAKEAIEFVEEVIKKPHILPKNAYHLESVKQGINFYHRQMRKRVDKLKESK